MLPKISLLEYFYSKHNLKTQNYKHILLKTIKQMEVNLFMRAILYPKPMKEIKLKPGMKNRGNTYKLK